MASKVSGNRSTTLYRALGIAAIVFGAATLKEGGSVLLIDGASRVAAGNYVAFVLLFNFAAGFFYVLSGIGILLQKRWAHPMALLLALSNGLVFAMLLIHILRDQPFGMRTLYAMTLRTAFWFFTAVVLHKAEAFQPVKDNAVKS